MIADRIRQARLAAGLTLGALGEQVGVSHTAIQKYEKGLLTPSSTQLLKLARACGIRTEYFFRTHTVELLQPEFRKLSTFGKTAQDALKIKVVELVEKRVELLGAFPELPFPAFAPPANLPEHITSLDEIDAFSDSVRNAWQLGLNPIADLTDTHEGLGLQDRVSQSSWVALANKVEADACRFVNQSEEVRFPFFLEVVFQFKVGIKVVFDGPFGLTSDHQDVLDARSQGFFDDELDGRFVNDGQHFLGQGLGGRQEAGSEARSWNDSLSYSFFHI